MINFKDAYGSLGITVPRLKIWNVDGSVVSPLKHSSNILYDGTHGTDYGQFSELGLFFEKF